MIIAGTCAVVSFEDLKNDNIFNNKIFFILAFNGVGSGISTIIRLAVNCEFAFATIFHKN